jgi:hypothetical protein
MTGRLEFGICDRVQRRTPLGIHLLPPPCHPHGLSQTMLLRERVQFYAAGVAAKSWQGESGAEL